MNSCNCILPLTNPNACVNCLNKSTGNVSYEPFINDPNYFIGDWYKPLEPDFKDEWNRIHGDTECPLSIQLVKDGVKYKNKKNGKTYFMTDELIFNATNGREHEVMIAYQDEDGKKYVREMKEFMTKFIKIEGGVEY